MPSSRLQVRATVAGAVAGIAVTVALVVAGPFRLPTRIDRSDAQADFLAAWERSRQGTYLVRGTFERRQPGGAVLSTPTELAQRPPSRLVRRFGGITGVIDGRPVSCTSDTGELRCTTGSASSSSGTGTTGPPPSYDELVQQELDAFRSWFAPAGPGQSPRYRVLRAPEAGCFDLVLGVFGAEAPYGTDSRICFDEATGAPRSTERRFDNGVVEIERADTIVAAVSDADLALPEGGSSADEPEEPDEPGEPATTTTPTTG